MFRLNKNYFLATALLFFTEMLIALYVHDDLLRLFGGDLLAVILIYCGVKSFYNVSAWKAAIGTFTFACFVEMLQYIHFVQRMELQKNTLARIIIGTSFSWMDIAAYAIGTGIVLLVENFVVKNSVAGLLRT